uniref:fumarylacetoacetase n=1 Tax=Acidobacterium capsulatum TaxID=33075 RepID=A0A7V5CU12_9BACT
MSELRSWIAEANDPATDFPLENLPFGVFRRHGEPHIGLAIGDSILDLHACLDLGYLDQLSRPIRDACRQYTLNALMALGRTAAHAVREAAAILLSEHSKVRDERLLVPQATAEMLLPARIGDYTDFYASIYHATNVGRLFRPDNPLLPNYKYVPIGYHGRASSLLVSGANVPRPHGQTKSPDAAAPAYGLSRLLDYELEMGFFVGRGNARGEAISIAHAEDHLFGLCLVNDWSARDVQAWEYQPLGPFLAKNFATTLSPWIVTLDALEPFRIAALERPAGDPAPLPYLSDPRDQAQGGFDIQLEVSLLTGQMREAHEKPAVVSRGNMKYLYWTLAQMLTHHASNGCPLEPGDLMASGTVSGPEAGSFGCLLEITQRGTQPLTLPNGEQRKFLEDGDEVIFRGWCERPGHRRIGFGECRGRVLPG